MLIFPFTPASPQSSSRLCDWGSFSSWLVLQVGMVENLEELGHFSDSARLRTRIHLSSMDATGTESQDVDDSEPAASASQYIDTENLEYFEFEDEEESDDDFARNDLRFGDTESEDNNAYDPSFQEDEGEEYYDEEPYEEEGEFKLDGNDNSDYYQPRESEDFGNNAEENAAEAVDKRVAGSTGSAKRANGKRFKAGVVASESHHGGLISVDLKGLLRDKKEVDRKKLPGKSAKSLNLSSNKITLLDIVDQSLSELKPILYPKVTFSSGEIVLPLNAINLLDLDLSSNRMVRFPSQYVCSLLVNLQSLNLENQTPGIQSIEPGAILALARHNSLTSLNLSMNKLVTLPREIGSLSNLRSLKLRKNSLISLPEEICRLEQLSDASSEFDVRGNYLVEPRQICATKGGIRWIRAYFQIAFGRNDNISVEDAAYYHLVLNQCDSPTGNNAMFGSGGGGDGSGKKKPKGGRVSHAPSGGADASRSLQLMMLVLGSEQAGKSSLIRQLVESAKTAPPADSGSLFANEGEELSKPRLARDTSSSSTISSTHSTVSGSGGIHRFVSGSSTATGSTALVRDISLGTVHSSPSTTAGKSMGRNHHLTPLQLPPSIEEDENSSYSLPWQNAEPGEIKVSRWHPRKARLNKFLQSLKGPAEPVLTAANLANNGSEGKHARRLREVQIFEQSNDVKFVVWDLGGASCCDSTSEMFFHSQALYLVVWDISMCLSNHDYDVHVQYWIDLIHARAPGSIIVIVATHCDLVDRSTADLRVREVQERVAANEERRRADLERDIEACVPQSGARYEALKRLQAPCRIDKNVIRVSCIEKDLTLIRFLACRLVRLATATADNRTPFGLINVELPGHHLKVKKCIESLMFEGNRDYCSVSELDDMVFSQIAERNRTPLAGESLSSSGSKPPTVPKKNRPDHLTKTKQALEHYTKVGEVIWFSGTELPDASSIVFFRPGWLSRLLTDVLDYRVVERITSKLSYSMVDQTQNSVYVNKRQSQYKLAAEKGVVQWQDVKDHLALLQYDPLLFEEVRLLLERHGLIQLIDHPEETAPPPMGGSPRSGLSKSISTSTLSSSLDSAGVRRNPSYDSMLLLSMTSKQSLSGKSSGSSGGVTPSASSTPPARTAPADQRRYLVPALVPRFVEDKVQFSGFVTLERFYSFNRCIPSALLHRIFAAVYNDSRKLQAREKDKTKQIHRDIYSASTACWDTAFKLQHEAITITVQHSDNSVTGSRTPVDTPFGAGGGGGGGGAHTPFTPFTPHRGGERPRAGFDSVVTPSSGGKNAQATAVGLESAAVKDEGYCSFLTLRGYGHMLISQTILKYLDYYCQVIGEVLQQYPGLGAYQYLATCPQCILNNESEENKGVFSHQEVVQLQRDFNLEPASGRFDASHLRYLNTKRSTCKAQRCQVHSDMLIHVPEDVKRAIEETVRSEHEVHFLLDEVVRSSSRPSKAVEKSVVRIMAAFGFTRDVAVIKSIGRTADFDAVSISVLAAKPLEVASGVVVSIPTDEECTNIHSLYNGTLVFSCDHIITDCKVVDNRNVFSRKFYSSNHDTIFFVGDQNNWLYVAEMIYQGSTTEDRESNFWDISVLRIIAPVKPISTWQDAPNLRAELLLRPLSVATVLHHPSYPEGAPVMPVSVSPKRLVVDQVVRLLGYPGRGELSVDWGRITQNNENGDIMVNLLSDEGSSGGPVLDRNGDLVGLLSRGHENYKNSCVQPLRNIFEILEHQITSKFRSKSRD